MKKLTMSALGLAVAFGAVFPANAQTNPSTSAMQPAPAEQPLTGRVMIGPDPSVMVQFPDNKEKTYALEPSTVKALNLNSGSTVMLSNHKLGTIVGADRQKVMVLFPDGETKTYYQTQEGRASLSYGDSVVITPSLRIKRASGYMLTAADVQVPMSTMASTPMSGTMTQPTSGMTNPTSPASADIKPAPTTSGASSIENVESSPASGKPMSPTEPMTNRVPVTSPTTQDIETAPASGKPMSPTTPAKLPDDGIPTIKNSNVNPAK